MWKKMMAIAISLCMMVGMTLSVNASEGNGEAVETLASTGDLSLNTEYTALIEANTGKLLYATNQDEKKAPASVTKIMTMALVLEQVREGKLKMEDMVTASEHAKEMGGTQINLDTGEQMSVYDLLMSLAVASANDSAVALAEHAAGSESGFVKMMNEKAAELGMSNTHFENPHGLPTAGHITTAYDIALMTRYFLSFEQSREFIGTKIYPVRAGENEYKMRNTNNLLWSYNGCIGGKTGYTQEAGYCMSIIAERDGFTAIAVVMGEKTTKERTADIETLLDHAFGTYELFTVPVEPVVPAPLKITRGVETQAMVDVPEMVILPQVVSKGSAPVVKQEMELKTELEAPVEMGQEVGSVCITMDEREIARFPLTLKETVPKRSFSKAFTKLLKNTLSM